MFFQFSPVRPDKKNPVFKKKETEIIETLLLTPFSQIPKLFFDNVKVGDIATQKLLIKNTTNRKITVFINSNVPTELNVTLNCNHITLNINEEKVLELAWCPSTEISARYILLIDDSKKIKKEVPVAFKSIDLNKPDIKRNNPKIVEKRQFPPKKSPTKKYYTAKPPNISPNRFSYKKISPYSNKYTRYPIQTCCTRPSPPKIAVNSLDSSNNRNLRTSPKINMLRLSKGKENNSPLPLELLSNISMDSNGFVSPNSAPFYLDNVQPREQGRQTYVLHSKNSNNLFESKTRRETYAVDDKTAISPTDEFNDSLENNTPLQSRKRENFAKKQPLGFHSSDNIMETVNLSPSSVDFQYKLLQLQSLCFSPLSTPKDRTSIISSTFSSALDQPNSPDIISIPKNIHLFPQNSTFEVPTNISGQTYIVKEDNTSCETYIRGNLSGGTYTKDSSIGNIETLSPSFFKPSSSPVIQVIENSTYNVSRTMDRKQLSCIQEESFIPSHTVENITHTPRITNLKRKSDRDFTFSPPKRAFIPSGPKNWSKKGSSALRISKHSTGLSIKPLVNDRNNENNKGIAEVTKTDTQKIIIQNPFLLAATNLIDPFMAPDLYINQQWIDQQEIDFKKWLNALLSPPKEFESVEQIVDVAKVWQECKKSDIEAVPSKKSVANQDLISNRLVNLRKAAQDLFRSEAVSKVLSKVCLAIDQGKLSIRGDRDVHLNLSIKSDIISILLSYNALWLRIGLETIYNEIIPLNSNSDIVGLSKFIVNRLFKDPYLIRKHKSVHNSKYTTDFNKFFLKRFLTLVYFLDQAKNKKLIPHDPCLFSKRAIVKDSREILLRLAKEILSAIGDITKFLKFSGYVVTHIQTYIHEFDYTVTNLGVDLRDGVRLTKIMELILLKDNLTMNLRVPAISRLQKIHNMKIVFESLKQAEYDILYDISPKDLVDGHKEKTLSFLWQIIYKFEAPLMVKSATTIQTWFRSLPVTLKRRKLMKEILCKENAAMTIQRWYRRNKSLETLVRFTKILIHYLEMRKKEKAAIKIQACFKMHICRKRYLKLTETITSIQVRYRGWFIRNVLRLQIQSAITIQKYVRKFLSQQRFLKLKRSTVYVQRKYRAKQSMKLDQRHYQKLKCATIFLQQRFKANHFRRIDQRNYQIMQLTAMKIQQKFRANKLCKIQRQQFLKIRTAVVRIQTWYRSVRIMKIYRARYKVIKNSVLIIEQHFIAYKEMTIALNRYVALKSATLVVQRKWRASRLMKIDYEKYQTLKNAAVCIQQKYRVTILQKKIRKDFIELRKAVIVIQRKWRAQILYREVSTTFSDLKRATILTQRRWRSNKLAVRERNRYETLKKAVSIIQKRWKTTLQSRQIKQDFINLKKATVLLQEKWRAKKLGELQKRQYVMLRTATIIIQTRFRAKRLGYEERRYYISIKRAAVVLQQSWKATKLGRKARSEFVNLKKSTVFIQRRWRALKKGNEIKMSFDALRQATIIVQQRWRARRSMKIERLHYETIKTTALMLQRRYRANTMMKIQYNSYSSLKIAAIFIQRRWRAIKIGRETKAKYDELKKTAILVQQKCKMIIAMKKERKHYINLKEAVIKIQRRFRANLLMRSLHSKYMLLKTATLFIQRRWRALRAGEQARIRFTAIRKATITIQQRWKAIRTMKEEFTYYSALKKTTITVQRRFRANIQKKQQQQQQKITKAAIKIQAFWRGYDCRQKINSRFDAIRFKLKQANESAAPEKTLEWKSKVALQTITNEKLTLFLVIKALEDLDMTTRHSKEICISMAQLLPEQLYLMLSVLTRSLPEINVAIASVNILITFCKYRPTRKYSFIPEHIDILITVMLHWCDKESMLFPITCTLLWLFAHVPEWKQLIINIPNFDQRFKKICSLVLRKQNMVKKTGTKTVSSVFGPYKDSQMPGIKNNWGLNHNASPNTFTNSFHALSSLSKILK